MAWLSKETMKPKITCADVVDAYGEFLEKEPFGIGGTLPEDKLPFYKSLIKEALASLAHSTQDQARREMLRAGFLQLAAFIKGGYKPNSLSASQASAPSNRQQIAEWMSRHGDELSQTGWISERIEAANEVLRAEWDIRLNVCSVSEAERLTK